MKEKIIRSLTRITLMTSIVMLMYSVRAYALPVPGSGILTGLLPCPVSSITINTATEQVIAYDLNNQPVQVFACSTGVHGNTYVGTYKTSNYYDWHLMNGGVYSRYAVRFNNHELMHSVPYYRHSPDSLEYRQFNRLGTPASAGCCRMALADAKWIYDNTVPGTIVNVIKDPNLVYPLTRPIIKVDESNTLTRGWDPTDTDPRSPYNAVPAGTAGASQLM
ncbi:MAG: L,D-transpeptidase [Lachnospiraceae bacterium]|nr:L,D-transpeptidase [Lachnospiraceae bacterium]